MTFHLKTESKQSTSIFLDHHLFCQEEKWEDLEKQQEEDEDINFHHPLFFYEELISLFDKEKQQQKHFENDPSLLSFSRNEAVQWMIRVNTHYGFSKSTLILAIDYLDRFLCKLHFEGDNKAWMFQLLAVACVSIAAKVEETHVPLLLDLQVEGAKYVFEAKTIQRMELLMLTTLEWKMNPITPISFIDHFIKRFGFKTHLHLHCQNLLISVVSDSRFGHFLPSVLATATMLHVINKFETLNSIEFQNQLLGLLKNKKDDVKECYELIFEMSKNTCDSVEKMCYYRKRKLEEEIPSSPSGVIDAYFSSESSNDSSSSSSIVCSSSSPEERLFKKKRAQEHVQ